MASTQAGLVVSCGVESRHGVINQQRHGGCGTQVVDHGHAIRVDIDEWVIYHSTCCPEPHRGPGWLHG